MILAISASCKSEISPHAQHGEKNPECHMVGPLGYMPTINNLNGVSEKCIFIF